MTDGPVANDQGDFSASLPQLTTEQRAALLDAIIEVAPEWQRAYEFRRQGLNGQELADALDLPHPKRARAWAKGVAVLVGEGQIGDYKAADRRASELADKLAGANGVDTFLAPYIAEVGVRARESLARNEYSSAQTRAWSTRRRLQAEEAEAEDELEDEVIDDVDTARVFQVYAWTYSGLLVADGPVVVKVGYAGTGPTSDAWRRMTDSARTTGSPGAPTMLRVWLGQGGRQSAEEVEANLHRGLGQRILGGGDEWFEANLDLLDAAAGQLGLKRHFAVNPG